MANETVEIYPDKNKQTRIRIKGGNGEILMNGEGLKNKSYAKKKAKGLAKRLGAKYKDLT